MMIGFLFGAFALLHILMLTYGIKHIKPPSFRKVFLFALLFGLTYDNTVLALGNVLVETSVFTAASLPRFLLHALVLPFLALFALFTMQAAHVKLSHHKFTIIAVYIFTSAALLYGVVHELPGLHLTPIENYEHWRMTNAEGGAPLATIAVNIAAIIMGALVWRAKGPYWLFAGALSAFVINTFSAPYAWSFITSNMAEIVFAYCLLRSEIALEKKSL